MILTANDMTVMMKEFLLRWERWIVGLVMGAVLGTGYYSLDIYLSRAHGLYLYDFSLPLDKNIPLIPWMIWVYSLYYWFCFIVIPLLTTRERFFRMALAFFLEFFLAFIVFLVFPSRIVRPEVAGSGISADALRWFYDVDPGFNIFPSLHVANSVLVAFAFFYYGSKWAWPVLISAVLISISTVFVKAHYLLDIPSGMALAFVSIGLAWISVKETDLKRTQAALVGLVFLLAFPFSVHANPMDHYGMGTRGAGMANAGVAVSNDWTAPYYNPAGMTRSGHTFGFGLLSTYDQVKISPKGSGKPTDSVEPVQGMYLGITHPMGTRNLRGGLGVYLPLQRYQMARTHFVDEREALPQMSNQLQFEFYGDREQRQVLLLALAYRFASWLSAGVGVSILNNTTANTSVYEPEPADPSKSVIDVSNNTIYTYAPVYGLVSELSGGLTLGAAYREKIDFPIHGNTNISLDFSGTPITLPTPMYLDFLVNYTPAQAVFGASFTGIAGVLLTGEFGWIRWSGFKDTHNRYPSPRLNDIFTPRVGAETKWDPWVFRGGYSFEPSPVPHQNGRTNIVDNNSHIVTVGAARGFHLNGHDARTGFFVQARYFVPRTETKKTLNNSDPDAPHDALPNVPGVQNPGYPGWESSGWIYAAGVDLSLTF